MDTRFKCEYCPQKFTTPANKKKHEHKACHSDRSPAEARRRAHNQTPEPEEGEGSDEEMSVNSEDWKYAIPLEVLKGQETRGVEDRDTIKKLGGKTHRPQIPLHPPPEAPAERQIKGVKVILRKIPPPGMGRRKAAHHEARGRTGSQPATTERGRTRRKAGASSKQPRGRAGERRQSGTKNSRRHGPPPAQDDSRSRQSGKERTRGRGQRGRPRGAQAKLRGQAPGRWQGGGRNPIHRPDGRQSRKSRPAGSHQGY